MMKIAIPLHKKVTKVTPIAFGAAFSGDGGRRIPPATRQENGGLTPSAAPQFSDISIVVIGYAMQRQPIRNFTDLQR
ncbi:hypothetical protein ACUTQ5_10140 [Serratia sp. NA_112.1]|uniref:hypothetical protein n=1 Tax=unclassified Serratia (in: enterobacteria) TaxID=2647522 RepID=UPI004046942B